jgi:hypothetical protein
MLKVESRMKCYEVNGSEPHLGGPELFICVRSHWNRYEFVEIEALNGEKFTVHAGDLLAAVANAQNSGKR